MTRTQSIRTRLESLKVTEVDVDSHSHTRIAGYNYYWLPQNITNLNTSLARSYWQYECAVIFRRINSRPCEYPSAQVYSYRNTNAAVRGAIIAGFILNVAMSLSQFIGWWFRSKNNDVPMVEYSATLHGYCLAGLGALPALYDMARGEYKAPDQEPHLGWQGFAFIMLCTIFGSIVSPALAIAGCQPERFLQSFILLLISGLKVVITVYGFIKRQLTPEVNRDSNHLLISYCPRRSKWNSEIGRQHAPSQVIVVFCFGLVSYSTISSLWAMHQPDDAQGKSSCPLRFRKLFIRSLSLQIMNHFSVITAAQRITFSLSSRTTQ